MQKKFDIGDLQILVGLILFLVGLYLIDWRLALAAAGGLITGAGVLRLRYVAKKRGDK